MKDIRKLGTVQYHLVEVSPFVYRGKLLIFESVRPRTPDNTHDGRPYLRIRELHDGTRDVQSPEEFAGGRILTEFGDGFTFGVPFVWDERVLVYASLAAKETESDDIHVFWSGDMKAWDRRVAIPGTHERLYNSSVCRVRDRFIMAYETNDPAYPAFTVKFAASHDLIHWTKLPVDQGIYGTDRYTACPTIRYVEGWFYMFYLERPTEEWRFETYLTRSRDLVHWEPSPVNPILAPAPDEDINNSDIDFAELNGRMVIYYSWGNQRGEERLAHAMFDGGLQDWLRACFP